MSLLYSLLIIVVALFSAAEIHRRQKASGRQPTWAKTVTTGIGAIFISLCGIGVLVGGLQSPYPIVGIVLFVVIFGGGLAAFLTFVNRRWPALPSQDTTAR